jgi:hypothetical protein
MVCWSNWKRNGKFFKENFPGLFLPPFFSFDIYFPKHKIKYSFRPIGEVVNAAFPGYTPWPSLITTDPVSRKSTKIIQMRGIYKVQFVVRFLNDTRRSWIDESKLSEFTQLPYNAIVSEKEFVFVFLFCLI